MNNMVNLRTDDRAREMWDRNRELAIVIGELCDPDMPPPMETLYVRVKKARKPTRPDVVLQKKVERRITLINSIIERGLDPEDSIVVRTIIDKAGNEIFEFLDGTHRACILLGLGLPVYAKNVGSDTAYWDLAQAMAQHPLDKYPLSEETE